MLRIAKTTFPFRSLGATAGLGLIGLIAAGQASAGCTDLPSRSDRAPASGHLTPAAYAPAGAFLRTSYQAGDEGAPGAAIVGLWKFEMKVDGNIIDFGTVIWHDDGTEVTLSGGRNPTTGDVCMGAWQQVGWNKFKLNHFGLAWNGGTYLGVGHIRMLVSVDPTGNTYSGTFTINQYLDSTTDPFEETSPPVATVAGQITATRVTAN